jgi:chitinase
LDWEYPGSRNGSRPTDKYFFTILIKEMNNAFKPHNFILSAAVAAGKPNIDNGYEIRQISK